MPAVAERGKPRLENVRCLLCGSGRTRTIWPSNIESSDADQDAATFDYSYASVTLGIQRHHRIVRCHECGLIYVSPRPTNDEGTRIYSEVRDERYASLRSERVELARPEVRQLERFATRGPLLDVGCGAGYFLEAAADRGWGPVTGVELNGWMVELGREKGFDIRQGQLAGSRFPDNRFEVVSYWDVLEHTTDPLGELRDACRVMRPGGLLVLLIPNAASFWARFLRERWWAVIRMHLYYFTPATIDRLLTMAGFRVEKMTTFPKQARYDYLANLLRDNRVLHGSIQTLLRWSGLGGRVLSLDPRDQLKIYARKMERPASGAV